MRHTFIVFMVMISAISPGRTQDDFTIPDGAIFTFTNAMYPGHIYFPETEWAADSQSFRFLYEQVTLTLYQYVIPANELSIIGTSRACAFIPSPEQMEKFHAVHCASSMSPDGRYIIYPTDVQICGEACSQVLALGDLESDQYMPIRLGTYDGYYVRWSEDSRAFLILAAGVTGGVAGVWYGSTPQNVESTAELQLTLVANFGEGDIGYVDISPDGQRVLVRGNGQTNYGFTLWDVHFPSSGQQFAAWADGQKYLKDDLIAGAAFLPDDPNQIMLVVQEGLVRYDLEAHQITTVINPAINTQWADWAYFSSDMRYVLVYDNFPSGEAQRISLFPIGKD